MDYAQANSVITELRGIRKSLETVLERAHVSDVPLAQLKEKFEFGLDKAPTHFAGEVAVPPGTFPQWVDGKKYKLADALADAICQEYSSPGYIAIPELRLNIVKWANRYYAHAEETESKFAKAQGEIYQMRHERHTATVTAYRQVEKLANLHLIENGADLEEFFRGLKNLIALNTPRKEIIE